MPPALLALLGALTAIGPLALDLYIPGFPQIANDLEVSASHVQLTMTACMIGLACGQLITGIVSDGIGRRTPLLAGMATFTLFSVACVFAPNIWLLVVARFFQGVGGGAGIVVARAVIRDRTSGEAMVRALTTVMILLGLAPIVGPMIGGALLGITDWRGVFGFLALLAVVMLAGSLTLRESLPVRLRRTGGFSSIGTDFAAVVRDPGWQFGAGTVSLTSAAVFVYIGASAFIFQDLYGVTPLQYSVLFGLTAMNFMIFSQANRLLGRWFSPLRRMTIAVGGICAGAAALVVAAAIGSAPIWLVILGFALLPASHGLGSPNGIAIALDEHGERAGSAAALHGVLQYVVGAVTLPLIGGEMVTIAVAVSVIAALLVLLRIGHGLRTAPHRLHAGPSNPPTPSPLPDVVAERGSGSGWAPRGSRIS